MLMGVVELRYIKRRKACAVARPCRCCCCCCCCNDTHPESHRPRQLADFSNQTVTLLWHLKECNQCALVTYFFSLSHLAIYEAPEQWVDCRPFAILRRQLHRIFNFNTVRLDVFICVSINKEIAGARRISFT